MGFWKRFEKTKFDSTKSRLKKHQIDEKRFVPWQIKLIESIFRTETKN